MNASIKRMYKTMAFSILAIHLAACFYYLIAKLVINKLIKIVYNL